MPDSPANWQPISVRLPPALEHRLRTYADRRKLTLTQVLIEALDDYLTSTTGRKIR